MWPFTKIKKLKKEIQSIRDNYYNMDFNLRSKIYILEEKLELHNSLNFRKKPYPLSKHKNNNYNFFSKTIELLLWQKKLEDDFDLK